MQPASLSVLGGTGFPLGFFMTTELAFKQRLVLEMLRIFFGNCAHYSVQISMNVQITY